MLSSLPRPPNSGAPTQETKVTMRTDVMYAVPEQETTSSPAKEITPAYRPPGAVEEPPEPLSKSALKNKKRREAAKNKAKVETETNGATETLQTNCQGAKGILSDPDKEKKIRKLNEKIQSIEKIKQAHSEGKPLEKNQIEKLSKEQELRDQLEALKLS